MSYLDLPRVHLGGTFFTDPSTVNNDPSHYDEDVTRPSPWQNPNGLHRFRFVDVRVNAAIDAAGKFVEHDVLLGVAVSSTDKPPASDRPSAAKIVDLDVYQQGVSTIFGFTVKISVSNDVHLIGAMDPCPANGLWFKRILPTRGWQAWDAYGDSSFGGDTYASAVFQSVLRIKPADWPADVGGVLSQLRSATTTDSDGNLLLSFRMVLDSYQNVPWHDDFNTGRVLATLGPVNRNEAPHIPGGRWLDPRPIDTGSAKWYWPNFYSAPFKFIERAPGVRRLVIDMADAICMQQPGGPPVPLGELYPLLGDGTAIGTFQVTQDFYQNLGGIIELPVSDDQWAAQDQALYLLTNLEDLGGTYLWSESTSGLAIDAIDQVFRLAGHAGTTATARVRIAQWGKPASGFKPAVSVVAVVPKNKGASVPWSAGYKGDTAQADGALAATVTAVDAQGDCIVTLTVMHDPGFRTPQLDGQLYYIMVYDPANGPPNMQELPPPRQETLISCIVFSQYNEKPSWETVKAIMTPYAKLYPGMTEQIDLTQQQAFFTFAVNPSWHAYEKDVVPYVLPDGRKIAAGAIPYLMTRGFNDPRFMPVTRDLSPDKLLHILTYIADIQAGVQPTPPPPGPSA
jgi:hypothetical protein